MKEESRDLEHYSLSYILAERFTLAPWSTQPPPSQEEGHLHLRNLKVHCPAGNSPIMGHTLG
jgi:hypothetical protein